MNKNFVLGTTTLIGTIIGAGVFGIPYMMIKSGIMISIFYFFILGAIVLFLHLAFGEIVLRTKEKHRLVGYSEKYLGKKAKIIVAFSTILGTGGALLAYIILSGKFLKMIFPQFFLTEVQFSLFFFGILTFFVFLGIKSIASLEFLMNFGFLIVVILIFFFSFPKIQFSNFVLMNQTYPFLPFGVLLFSLIGWNAVPEIERILKEKKNLKKIIILAISVVLCFYFLFGVIISGVSGSKTTPETFEGLSFFLGKKIIILGAIFALFSIATSFLVLANYLKNTFIYDFGLSYFLAFLLASFSPLIFFLIGFRRFILVIKTVGVFVGLIEGGMILLIHQKAKKIGEKLPSYSLKMPKFLPYLIIFTLFLGAISQIII